MAKSLKNVLNGVKSSTVNKMNLSDWEKSQGGRDFAAMHDIEKHEDRVGNGDDVYNASKIKHSLSDVKNKRLRPKTGVYEAKEEMKCNMTESGKVCPIHGLKDCSKQKTINEVSPSNPKIEKWIKDNKKRFVDEYGEKKGKEVLYAKAWKMDKSMEEAYDDKDEESSMVRAELKALANKSMHLVMKMPNSMHIEPWVQAKVAQAKSMLNDVHDYMLYGDHVNEDFAEPLIGESGKKSVKKK